MSDEKTGDKKMTLAVKRLTETAKLPTKGSDGAAGFDLYADEDCKIDSVYWPGIKPAISRKLVSTGIAVAIDPGKVGLIWPRSGMAVKSGIMTNAGVEELREKTGAGVIDSDYRGEIKVLLFNFGESVLEIKRGDRIAQLLIMPVYGQSVVEVDDLSDTARGIFGFGSTGR